MNDRNERQNMNMIINQPTKQQANKQSQHPDQNQSETYHHCAMAVRTPDPLAGWVAVAGPEDPMMAAGAADDAVDAEARAEGEIEAETEAEAEAEAKAAALL